MKQYRIGQNTISLTQNDFIAAGGQGQVFARGNTAYKIYKDPASMISLQKISELKGLTNKDIIKPEEAIYSGTKPVGYTMRFITGGIPLCQLFTKAYRQRNKITPAQTLNLVKKFQDIVQHAHDNGILIVDLNEMNFLSNDQAWNEIYAIDVDSWQTKSFPATVIMDSIRDRHNKSFNEGTDWFSFGIVSFNMFIGIHPYKGHHPTVKDVDARMKQNISVLNPDVKTPPACYDLSVIPPQYLDWYKAIFEKGERTAPPFDSTLIVSATVMKKVLTSGTFTINELFDTKSNILAVAYVGSEEIILSENQTYLNRGAMVYNNKALYITQTNKGTPLIGYLENDTLKVFTLKGKEIKVELTIEAIVSYKNTLYGKCGQNIVELIFNETAVNTMALTRVATTVMPNTRLKFDGCIIQEMIGSKVLTVFPGEKAAYQIIMKELEDEQVIDAKFDSGVLMVLSSKGGKYTKWVFRFSEDYSEHDVRKVVDIATIPLNFTVLDNGIVAHVNENDELELFKNKYNGGGVKTVANNQLDVSKMLHKGPMGVQFIDGHSLYSLKMK